MQQFDIRDIKTPTLKQTNNKTKGRTLNKVAGFFNISTKDNIAVASNVPGTFSIRSGVSREVIQIPGFTKGVGNGRVVQTTGNYGLIIDCEMLISYGKYIPLRNKILKLLTSTRPFNLQTFTTQKNQTIQQLNNTKNNYIHVIASDISFSDTFNGRVIADGSDSIKFTAYEIPEPQKPKSKRSIFNALSQATDFLDKVQTNVGSATLALQGVNNALIETAKSVSSFGSGVSSFIQEVNQLKNSVGTLVKSPKELAKAYGEIAKSFKSIFSSGDSATQRKYYAPLKNLVEYNKNTPLPLSKIKQRDTSFGYVYSNIEKNIITGKATTFLRAIALLTICSNYENFEFDNTDDALEAWNNVVGLFDFFSKETRFDGVAPGVNIASKFTNNILTPLGMTVMQDYVFQTLESIRNAIFNQKEIETKVITETTTVFHVVAYKYGRIDDDELKNFMLINKFTDYSMLVKSGTIVKFV
jgi:hypothetical protein